MATAEKPTVLNRPVYATKADLLQAAKAIHDELRSTLPGLAEEDRKAVAAVKGLEDRLMKTLDDRLGQLVEKRLEAFERQYGEKAGMIGQRGEVLFKSMELDFNKHLDAKFSRKNLQGTLDKRLEEELVKRMTALEKSHGEKYKEMADQFATKVKDLETGKKQLEDSCRVRLEAAEKSYAALEARLKSVHKETVDRMETSHGKQIKTLAEHHAAQMTAMSKAMEDSNSRVETILKSLPVPVVNVQAAEGLAPVVNLPADAIRVDVNQGPVSFNPNITVPPRPTVEKLFEYYQDGRPAKVTEREIKKES